jgi:hypothetical protein
MEAAPEILTEIAEKVFNFTVVYKGESKNDAKSIL